MQYLKRQEQINPANSPHFFLKKKKKQNNKQYGNNIICKGKIKPVYAQWCHYRKTVARPTFYVFPKMYLHSSLKKHRGQTQLVPRLHITICQVNWAIKHDAIGLGTES
jgi:hypothetical protein